MPTLIDTHAHLDQPDFDEDREAVIIRAREAGVGQMVQVAVTPDTWVTSLEIARAYPFIRTALGVHPNDAGELTATRLAELRTLIAANRELVVGIGETGLDYYRDWTTPEQQHPAFIAQLALGREFDLPVIVHCRNANAETIRLITEQGGGTRGVMHCFSGNLHIMEQAIALGYYISLAGPVTFKNAHDRHEVAANVPLDWLLVETDCPFLTPEPFRGRRNEPARVVYTAAKIAELRGISMDEVATATTANARRLFALAEVED
jgi:TatD DNase family protein